jgi:Fe-S-cluster containining protein
VVVGQHEKDTSEGFYLNSTDSPYYLMLDKKQRFTRTRPCVFLMSLAQGQEKCGIYEHRPAICRAYPMSMMHGEARLSRNAICPSGSWSQEEMGKPVWREAVRRTHVELDLYTCVVSRWNARVAHSPDESFTFNEYFSYLLNVFGAISRLEREVGEAEMARVEASWPTPPRAYTWLSEVPLSREDHPWLDFMLRASAIIDTFYPAIAPQPFLSPLPA